MNSWNLVTHLNNNPGSEYISECGNFLIDQSRKNIVLQQGMPVIEVNFEGIPESVKWKVK